MNEVLTAAKDAGDGFKKMNTSLLIFCAVVTISIVLISISLIKK